MRIQQRRKEMPPPGPLNEHSFARKILISQARFGGRWLNFSSTPSQARAGGDSHFSHLLKLSFPPQAHL